jgi:hypothetical protein
MKRYRGGERWIRTTEVDRQLIYSQPPLATWVSPHMKLVDREGLEPSTCRLRVECSTIELAVHAMKLERVTRFELATYALARRRSTAELNPQLKWLRL